MKPRFSILSLLVVTLYVAVAVVGAANPLSPWGFAVFPMWVVAAVCLVNRVAQSGGARSVFAEGFVVASTAFVALEMLGGVPSTISHQALETLGVTDPFEGNEVATRYRVLFMAHGGLWFATLAGFVAAWQYGRRTIGEVAEEPAA